MIDSHFWTNALAAFFSSPVSRPSPYIRDIPSGVGAGFYKCQVWKMWALSGYHWNSCVFNISKFITCIFASLATQQCRLTWEFVEAWMGAASKIVFFLFIWKCFQFGRGPGFLRARGNCGHEFLFALELFLNKHCQIRSVNNDATDRISSLVPQSLQIFQNGRLGLVGDRINTQLQGLSPHFIELISFFRMFKLVLMWECNRSDTRTCHLILSKIKNRVLLIFLKAHCVPWINV